MYLCESLHNYCSFCHIFFLSWGMSDNEEARGTLPHIWLPGSVVLVLKSKDILLLWSCDARDYRGHSYIAQRAPRPH